MQTVLQTNDQLPDKPQVDMATELMRMDPAKIPSPVIARLINEVRNEEPSSLRGYNRFHNRHNR